MSCPEGEKDGWAKSKIPQLWRPFWHADSTLRRSSSTVLHFTTCEGATVKAQKALPSQPTRAAHESVVIINPKWGFSGFSITPNIRVARENMAVPNLSDRYSRGGPGIAALVIRMAVCVTLFVPHFYCSTDITIGVMTIALQIFAFLIVIGFLTRLCALGVCCLGLVVEIRLCVVSNLLALLLGLALVTALLFLGAGAYSIDSVFFARRRRIYP
jgi:hypothetical protein